MSGFGNRGVLCTQQALQQHVCVEPPQHTTGVVVLNGPTTLGALCNLLQVRHGSNLQHQQHTPGPKESYNQPPWGLQPGPTSNA